MATFSTKSFILIKTNTVIQKSQKRTKITSFPVLWCSYFEDFLPRHRECSLKHSWHVESTFWAVRKGFGKRSDFPLWPTRSIEIRALQSTIFFRSWMGFRAFLSLKFNNYRTRVRSLGMLVSDWLTNCRLVNLIDVTLASYKEARLYYFYLSLYRIQFKTF